MIKNLSLEKETSWEEDGLIYTETIRQEYTRNNCIFSGGTVKGHEYDTVFLRFEKEFCEPFTVLLTPDEMAGIAWVAAGVCWSELMKVKKEE